MGEFPYPNWDALRGPEVDQSLRWKFDPTIKDVPRIRGWLYETEGKALAQLAKDRNVLEIGSYCGLSTVWMARTAEHVTAVDTFESTAIPESLRQGFPADTYQEFLGNLKFYKLDDKVTAYRTNSVHLPLILGQRRPSPIIGAFNMVFIDAEHTYEAVKQDVEVAKKLMADDCIIAFHDYNDKENAEVSAYIDTELYNDSQYRVTRVLSQDRILALRFMRIMKQVEVPV
jgi:predicted O-methyltransferase YrrM